MKRLLFAAALAIAPGVPAHAAATSSPLGTNLESVTDYAEAWVFIDAFRATRGFMSGTQTQWNDNRALSLDANGWVTSLLPGQEAHVVLLGSQFPLPTGNWIVLYDGKGTIRYGGAATYDTERSKPNRHVLQVDPARRTIQLAITATTAGDHVRNIRVIMPGGTCSDDPTVFSRNAAGCAGKGSYLPFEANHKALIFHPQFLASLKNYRLLRFMDWGRINGSTQSRWGQRARLNDAHWGTEQGVPIEVMVDLANKLGADAWFNIPHLADNNYVSQYAALVAGRLDSGLKAYVEYSNETWNYVFPQAGYVAKEGQARNLSANAGQAAAYFHSLRSVEVFDLWSAQFGSGSRLVRVMASQASNTWLSAQLLGYQNAAKKTDALAIAPYFGGRLGSPEERTRVSTLTLGQLLDEIDTVHVPQAIAFMKSQATEAKGAGVALIAYEGGQHLVGYGGVEADDGINDLFNRANRAPRMGTLYKKYLNGWKSAGGQVFVHFLHTWGTNKWGRWGALEYQEQPRSEAPKFDALQDFIAANPKWW